MGAPICALQSQAADVLVTVIDREGESVPNVVVYVDSESLPRTSSGTAVMDQKNVRFVPHILVVQSGTSVQFPNNDEVAHHVYSFSKPNQFKLPIYKGEAHAPVTFDHSGIATLGCNIHDQMLAYILVVDTPKFVKTDVDGVARLVDVPAGDVAVSIWSPRLKDDAALLSRRADIADNVANQYEFKLTKKLRRPHEHDRDNDHDALSWSSYD